MKKPIVLALAISAALTLIAIAQPASANHSWNGYHWGRTTSSFTLKLADNLTSNWDSYLVTTKNDWSQSPYIDLTIVAGSANPRKCPAAAGRVNVCNARYGFNGWLGIAGIQVSGGHITASYVKVNDSYFDTATYNTPAWRNLVMCQEVAHAFGLGHQDENFDNPNLGTCMDYTNDPSTNQHPNQHDFDQIATIYNHTDSVNTYNLTGNVGVDVPASDYIDVDIDAFGNGWITHIFPVPGVHTH